MKNKRKKHPETSKVALAGILIFCGVAFIIGLAGWLCGMDDAATILGIIAGIAVLIVRYYMQKAQAENLVKIKRANKYTDAELDNLMELASHGTKSDEE